MPQVSVVISTYNRRRMLAAALSSALAQRGVDFEVIVVDNGSMDDTGEMLASWKSHRLNVIRNEHSLGSIGGRNTGLVAARGEWVGFLDDDDLWAPDKLRAQLDAAESRGRHWAYTGCVYIDGQDRILGGRRPPTPEQVVARLPHRFVLPGGMSNVIWRRGTLDADGLLDPRLPFPADWDVSLRLVRGGPPAAVARPLVAYRQHGSNISRRAARAAAQLAILERKHEDLRATGGLDWGGQYRFIASEQLKAGGRLDALRSYGRAVVAGDLGSLPRSIGVVLPRATREALRRSLLSSRTWTAEAEGWLTALRGTGDPPVDAFGGGDR